MPTIQIIVNNKMSSAKTIAKSVGLLFSTQIFDKLFSFLLVIVITRYLGSVGFGKYSFAFAFIGLAVLLSHLGLSTYIFREIAKDKSQTKKLADNVLTLKLFLLVGVYFVTIIIATILPKTKEIILLLFLVMVHEVFTTINTLIWTIFKAYERNEFSLYTTVIDKGFALLFGAYALIGGYGLYGLILALILSKIISFLFSYLICYKNFVKIYFEIDFKLWKNLIKNSLPFWLTMLFDKVYYNINILMLSWMKDYSVTGWYNAASTLVTALTFIPGVIISSTFPAMSRFHHTNSKDFLRLLYKKSFYYLLLIGIPISIGISLLAQRLILFIYKEQFIESGVVLKILSWSLVFVFANYIMGYFLNSINKQHLFTVSAAICVVVNITANFVLIPRFSYIGAATATIFSQFINFCLLYYFTTKNKYPINLLEISYKPIIAGIIMGAIVVYIGFLPIVYIIPIAALGYFVSLFLIKGIGKEEINLVKSFLPKKS